MKVWDELDEEDRRRITSFMGWLGLFLAADLTVAALSILDEYARGGREIAAWIPWVTEGSSRLVIFILTAPLALFLFRRDLAGARLKEIAVFLALGSLAFSVIHVTAMVLIRKAAFAVVGLPYIFADSWQALQREGLYEFRKDALTFTFLSGLIMLVRLVAEQRRELDEIRTRARTTHRLTLKCGHERVMLSPDSIDWIKAAGNYVEVKTPARMLLARSSLKAMEDQLIEAEARFARVHRGWLVNLDKIEALAPNGHGDITLRLETGEEIQGSRRYCKDLDLTAQ